MKLLPEGIGKFTEIIDNDLYFVDKTRFIKTLDESRKHFLFFVRPRLFGKSVFLNMLEIYYAIARKDLFDYIKMMKKNHSDEGRVKELREIK